MIQNLQYLKDPINYGNYGRVLRIMGNAGFKSTAVGPSGFALPSKSILNGVSKFGGLGV